MGYTIYSFASTEVGFPAATETEYYRINSSASPNVKQMIRLPSGKRLQFANWKITMLFMGKSTISTGPFSIAMFDITQRVYVPLIHY